MESLNHVPTNEQLLSHTWTLAELLEGARQKNDAHIGELSRRFGDRLLMRLYRTHPVFAGEVATDTFMALPALLVRYDDQGKFEGWLYSVALNRLRSRTRAERNERLTSGSALDNIASSRVVGRTFEQQEIIERLLSHLDERQQRVWRMLEEGYSGSEVARLLSLDENLVYQIKFRAKKKLLAAARQMLEM